MYKLDFYIDGHKQKRSAHDYSLERAIKLVDLYQKTWSKNLMPQVKPGEFDPNNGSEVIRESAFELLVITTGGIKLRWIIREI